jgi:hypothetical protein
VGQVRGRGALLALELIDLTTGAQRPGTHPHHPRRPRLPQRRRRLADLRQLRKRHPTGAAPRHLSQDLLAEGLDVLTQDLLTATTWTIDHKMPLIGTKFLQVHSGDG